MADTQTTNHFAADRIQVEFEELIAHGSVAELLEFANSDHSMLEVEEEEIICRGALIGENELEIKRALKELRKAMLESARKLATEKWESQ